MISLHRNKESIGDGSKYARDWSVIPSDGIWELAGACQNFAVSGNVWKDGIRNKSSFERADWIGLDFDEGVSLDTALAEFAEFTHIIGTSKSHGLIKNGVKSDRFHVFLKLAETIRDHASLTMTTKALISVFAADTACSDAARFFWPCRDLISVRMQGKEIQPIPSHYKPLKIAKTQEDVSIALDQKMVDRYAKNFNKGIPPHVERMLKCPPGGRNLAIYKAAKDLTKCGWTDVEIFRIIDDSEIGLTPPEMNDDELMSAIENGIKSALKIKAQLKVKQ